MAKVSGAKRHSDRLRAMAMARDVVTKALFAAGKMIEIDAEISITEGSISGEDHVVSRPREPPNADTRFLDTHIETTIPNQSNPTIHVTSNAPYSAALEYGTGAMIERPFMRPAVAKNRHKAARLVADGINISIRRR